MEHNEFKDQLYEVLDENDVALGIEDIDCLLYTSEQRDIEARIEELEKILKNAEVVVEDEVDLEKINIGCTVHVYDCEFEEELEFKIVGSTEANSLQGKISNESPVGKALLGHVVGDTVTVETQAGVMEYKVLRIERTA